jgi:hypothetical protein
MTIQNIRRFFEERVAAAVAPLPLLVDNQNFTESDSAQEYASMRLDFGVFSEPVIGDSIESIQGSLVVELYVPKGIGPGRGQELATQVLIALGAINRRQDKPTDPVRASVNQIIGPNFYALDGRPHFLARLSCGFRATYTGSGPQLPPTEG